MERLVRFARVKLLFAVAVVVCSMGLAAPVDAITTNFAVGDQYYLGQIFPDGGSPTTEAEQINVLVGLAPNGSTSDADNTYERSSNTLCFNTCPTATADGNVGEETGKNGGDDAGSFDDGFTYLKAKYDALQGGAFVWYVAGLTGDFTVPLNAGTCGTSGCGLSHWLLLNPGGNNVAEPSTTLLAGLAFAGIAFVGRKLKFFPRA